MTDITASTISEYDADTPRAVPDRLVGDRRFIDQLDQLRFLKQFLFSEKVRFKADDLGSIDLDSLNNITYKQGGRSPSVAEWRLLDHKMFALAAYLNDDLRKKIRIRELGTFFGIIPVLFLLTTILSTLIYSLNSVVIPDQNSLPSYLLYLTGIILWCISQGGLGACAFLCTSVIVKTSNNRGGSIDSSKDSIELVDITDQNFLKIRILLGTLFGFLIGLPFSLSSLAVIYQMLFVDKDQIPSPSATQLAIVVVPFIVGFSTNLVLVILGRTVVAIETFFGLPGRAS
jgi:hypothetical protein